MCTVTYLPSEHGFLLTHNRDEAPHRSVPHLTREGALVFPRDTAGGSWIASQRHGRTACILNGAFTKHQHQPPYRRSRGLLLLDSFAFASMLTFWETYDCTGIEPFTLLAFEPHAVLEGRWDGRAKHLKHVDAGAPQFWCSATLYDGAWQERREAVFRAWLLEQPRPQPADALRLHRHGAVGDPAYDFVMNRDNRVRTVSITQVHHRRNNLRFRFEALPDGPIVEKKFHW